MTTVREQERIADRRAAVQEALRQVKRLLRTAAGTVVATSLAVSGNASVAGNLSVGGTITGTLAGNAATATALADPRTLWGQSFDGTANVDGLLTATVTTAAGSSQVAAFVNDAAADVLNRVNVSFQVRSTTQNREAFRINAGFSDTTDASRTTAVSFQGQVAGVFSTILSATGQAVSIPGTLAVTGSVTLGGLGFLIASGNAFSLRANTADTADTAQLNLSGGGGISSNRGAFANLFGNEHATNPGRVLVTSGNVSGSDFLLQIKGVTFLNVTRPAATNILALTGQLTVSDTFAASGAATIGGTLGVTGVQTNSARTEWMVPATTIQRLRNTLLTADARTFDWRVESDGGVSSHLILRTTNDAGTTVKNPFRVHHTTGLIEVLSGSGLQVNTGATFTSNAAAIFASTLTMSTADLILQNNARIRGGSDSQSLLIGTSGSFNWHLNSVSGVVINLDTDATSPASATFEIRADAVDGSGTLLFSVREDGLLSALGAVSLSPANANVVLSPTGTGLVTINPATAGAMDNVVIGALTPAAGTFTTLGITGALTFNEAGADVDARFEGDTLTHLLFLDAGSDSLAFCAAAAPNFQSGVGIGFFGHATTAPTGDPTDGYFLWADADGFWGRSPSGAITQLLPA
jgi:hypothetical protein